MEADGKTVYDAITGLPLNLESVRRAKEEELKQIRDFGVYKKGPIQEC